MKGNNKLTTELKRIFTHIKQDLIKEYPNDKILIEYFLMAILNDENSVAYQIIEKITLSETIEVLRETIVRFLSSNTNTLLKVKQPLFDDVYDTYIQNITKEKDFVDSGLLLMEIIKNNTEINKTFRGICISLEEMEKCYNEHFVENQNVHEIEKSHKNKKKENNSLLLLKPINNTLNNNDVEKYLTNISN